MARSWDVALSAWWSKPGDWPEGDPSQGRPRATSAFFTQRLWPPIGATRISLYWQNPEGRQGRRLPVQLSTNFELVVNLKTAKALGLIVSPSTSRER